MESIIPKKLSPLQPEGLRLRQMHKINQNKKSMKKLIVLLALVGFLFFGYAAKTTVQPADSSSTTTALSDSVNQKLTSDQLFELEKMKLEQIKMENEMMLEESPTDLVAIFVPISMFLVAFFIVYFVLYFRRKERDAKYKVIEKALEHGQTLPEGLFEEKKVKRQWSSLRTGVILLTLGIGIFISFLLINEKEASFLGIIPIFLGLGFLLIGWIEVKKKNQLEKSEKLKE